MVSEGFFLFIAMIIFSQIILRCALKINFSKLAVGAMHLFLHFVTIASLD